jgi:hypothetical protein
VREKGRPGDRGNRYGRALECAPAVGSRARRSRPGWRGDMPVRTKKRESREMSSRMSPKLWMLSAHGNTLWPRASSRSSCCKEGARVLSAPMSDVAVTAESQRLPGVLPEQGAGDPDSARDARLGGSRSIVAARQSGLPLDSRARRCPGRGALADIWKLDLKRSITPTRRGPSAGGA